MTNTLTNFITSLLPYEFTVSDNLDMYDHLTYTRDVNLCNDESITLESGNVIKRYRYNTSQAYGIDNSRTDLSY